MTITSRRERRTTAAFLIAGAATLNLAFLGLAAVFDYPAVLDHPAAQVLASFREHQGAVVGWFLVLALGAALLAPIAVLVGRLGSSRALRLSVWVGVAAATVQVVGLLRWPLLVPSLAGRAADPATSTAAEETFRTLNQVLGTTIGETLGYTLTALWTVLVTVGLGRAFAGRWFTIAGFAAAGLIATGVLVPLEVPATDLTNFAGYVVWSVWLVGAAVVLLRDRRSPAPLADPTVIAQTAPISG
jgi:hypothetical protein